jgi:uncharacterized SAM-dependent methyltransferase
MNSTPAGAARWPRPPSSLSTRQVPSRLALAKRRNAESEDRDEEGAELDPAAFRHEARVLADPPRVEAHLVARRATEWRLGGRTIGFAAGESLHTDDAYKYGPDAFRSIAARAGWAPVRHWPDADGRLGLHLLRG